MEWLGRREMTADSFVTNGLSARCSCCEPAVDPTQSTAGVDNDPAVQRQKSQRRPVPQIGVVQGNASASVNWR